MPCRLLSSYAPFIISFAITFLVELSASTNLSNKMNLYDHIIETFISKTSFNPESAQINCLLTEKDKRKLSKQLFLRSQLPVQGECYDWRHEISCDYYFKPLNLEKDFKRAAERYKMIMRIYRIVKDISGTKIAEEYLMCWLTTDIQALDAEILCKELFQKHPSSGASLVQSFDESLIYGLVLPKHQIKGVSMSHGLLLNSHVHPVFIYEHTLTKGKSISNKHNLYCLAFKSKQCPCKRRVDWTVPLYSYPLVSAIFIANYHLFRIPFKIEFLGILSLLIDKSQNQLRLSSEGQNDDYCDNVDKDNGTTHHQLNHFKEPYNSGFQLLKDLWPGSYFRLCAYSSNTIGQIFASSNDSLRSSWSIFPKTDQFVRDSEPESKALFTGYMIEEGLAWERAHKTGHSYVIFRPNSYYFACNPPSGQLDEMQALFSPEYFFDFLLRITDSSTSSGANKKSKKTIFDLNSLCQILQSKTILAALEWTFDADIRPVPTLETILTLVKIVNLENDNFYEHSNIPPSQESLALSKLLLIGFLFYRPDHQRSKTFKEIWTDILSKDHCQQKGHFKKIVRTKMLAQAFCIKTVPFPYGILLKDDVIMLIEEKAKCIPFGLAKLGGFYIWNGELGMSTPMLLEIIEKDSLA